MGGLHCDLRGQNQASSATMDTCQADVHLNWVDLLAYLGAPWRRLLPAYKAADMTQVAKN